MTIRTRFDLGQTPTGRFLEFLQPPMGAGQRPMATTYITSPQPTMRGDIPMRVRPQPQPQPIGLRGITGVTQPLPARPMTALERDIAMKMGLGQRKAPPPPPAKPSLMDRLTPAVGTPEFAGLSQAAATGLQLSGWQDRPVTLGQGLGAMFGAGMKAYQEQKRADLADRIAMAQLSKKSDFEAKLALAGIDPTTPEGQKKVQEMLMKPSTVFMGGDEQKKEAYKAALATRKDMVKQVNQDRELGVRLQQAIDLLSSGTETGRFQSAMLPLKQLAREANILGDEELQNLSNLEIINSIASFLTPRMRVVGSGASSDRDMDFFASSTVKMTNSPQANLVIATMQKQVMDYNRERLDLFDDYVKEHGDDFGFGKYADEKMGSVYKRIATDDELTELVDSGAIKEGDVFYNGITREFDILTKEMM